MKDKHLYPRPDQIYELTRGLSLPLPNLAHAHLNVIVEGLMQALEHLYAMYGHQLSKKSEEEINALLHACLNNIGNRLFSQIVSCVVRGPETVSFDGSHLNKRPDIAIYLTRRINNFPLLVECKILDVENGKTVELYCKKGLKRFVDGEYAWGLGQSLMLAYVRDEFSIEQCLVPHLSALASSLQDDLRTEALPKKLHDLQGPVAVSQHGRLFHYTSDGDLVPGPISIFHIWVDIPQVITEQVGSNAVNGAEKTSCEDA